MAKISKEQRQASVNRNQMQATWTSFQHLLEDDLKRLDYRMYKMYQEARGFGVEHEFIQQFVRSNMEMLIAKTVDRREKDEQECGHRRVR